MLGRLRTIALLAVVACAAVPSFDARAAETTTKPDPFKAKLADNAALAGRAATSLGNIAKKSPPRGSTADEKRAWDEQSRWLSDASSRFAAMKKTMDAVLAKTKVSPSELAQTSMQFAALQDATQTESQKFDGLSRACHERNEAAIAAVKGSS